MDVARDDPVTTGHATRVAAGPRDPAASACAGALPDFVVIGAEKAGTSSLHLYLSDHPAIYMPAVKEVRFFDLDQNHARGLEWYRQFFAHGRPSGARVLGEASPGYLHFPRAAGRMRAAIPDARLIAVLRDPVQRAYSHHWNRVRGGLERRPFAQVVADHLDGREASPIVEIGRYADHLERFFAVYPRERLLITFTDRLQRERAQVCAEIFAFLGVDPGWVPRNLHVIDNPAALPRSRSVQRVFAMNTPLKRALKRALSAPAWQALRRRLKRMNYRRFEYPEMERAVEARLRAYYREPDARLTDLLQAAPPWVAAPKA